MKTLRNVEIFYPGEWNGDVYTEADVIEMCNTANECAAYIQPQLSLNHSEVAPDIIQQASFGAAVNFCLRRVKGVYHLFCDIARVRDELADLLLYHYPRRSVELLTSWFHPEQKRQYRNVLTGISFLGARMPPGVEGMIPEFSVFNKSFSKGSISIVLEEQPMGTKQFEKTNPVAARRGELGLTVADVVKRMNEGDAQPAITEQTLLDIEAGLTAPSPDIAALFAKALETDVVKLFANDQDALERRLEESVKRYMRDALKQFQAEGETLGAYLKAAREEKGLTVEEVAQACEITPEQLTAYESGELIADDDLKMIADVMQLDLEDLRKRRGVVEEKPAEKPAEGEKEFQQKIDSYLAPYKREMLQFKRERDAERQRNRELETDQFLEGLTVKFKASKALTGDTARTLLLTLDDTQVRQFAKDSQPETPRVAFKRFLETLARAGMVSVPTGQITDPAKSDTKEFAKDPRELKKQVEAYQKQHNIPDYFEAQRLMIAAATGGK